MTSSAHMEPMPTKNYAIFGGLIVLLIVLIGVIVWLSVRDNHGSKAVPPKQQSCKKDADCAADHVCGDGATGCCAICGPEKTCQAGMVTAKGCQSLSSVPEQDKKRAYGMGWFSGWSDWFGDKLQSSVETLATPDTETKEPHKQAVELSEDSCMDDATAYQRACIAKGDLSPACCGVCVNGQAFAGVRGPDGVCQTAIQQMGYSGMGQQPPNTYIISSSGPKYGVSMGGCTVDPVGSSLAMHAGLYSASK